MTERSDIIDGSKASTAKYGLVYTKKCGWIDLGHANPENAQRLWNKINQNNRASGSTYALRHTQYMGNRYVRVHAVGRYSVNSGLSLVERKSVALSIFLDVSMRFEGMQASWLFSWVTNSGFSAEDLMSNLLGFYRAVEPGKPYVALCEPVTKAESEYVWDTFGAVGENKNYSPGPYLYPTAPDTAEGPMCGTLPMFLDTIRPAKQGRLFRVLR